MDLNCVGEPGPYLDLNKNFWARPKAHTEPYSSPIIKALVKLEHTPVTGLHNGGRLLQFEWNLTGDNHKFILIGSL